MSLEAPACPRSRGIFLVPHSHHLAAGRASDRGQQASARGVTGRREKRWSSADLLPPSPPAEKTTRIWHGRPI